MNIKIFFFLIAFSIVLFGCKKFVEADAPVDRLVTTTVFSNDATASSAMAGVYSNMINAGFANGGLFSSINILSGLSADELINYNTGASYVQFYTNALLPTNSDITNNIWGAAYADIFAANSILKGLDGSGVSDSMKTEMTGEAKFIRAFCHFYLVNLFGDVPLVITSDYQQNAVAPKTAKQDVYKQIITDLKDAQSLLRSDFSFSKGERTRPNKIAATALLARVYLYSGDPVNAEATSSVVINAPGYSLLTDLNSVFLKNSQEAIWQLVPYNVTNEANFFVISNTPTGIPNTSLSDRLLNAFEANDNRKTNWTKSVIYNSKAYPFPYKYKVNSGTNYTEYSMVLRIAEQYLIRSEARAQQNNISGAQADLNAIRTRAGLPNTTAADKASLVTAILHEKQVELFTEWGHRWLDLKRSGTVDAVMSVVTAQKGGTWNTNWQLYPIPLTQITNDPAMAGAQNPGY